MKYETNIAGFELVEATIDDCKDILDLIYGIAKYEKMTHQVEATEDSLKESIFIRKRANVILAKEHGKIIGYMLYFYNFSTFVGRENLYLEDLFLYEEYRHKGYGKVMFRVLAQIAVTQDVKRIDWVCLNWNQSGLDFYKRIGANPLDFWVVHRLEGQAIKKLAEI